MSDAKYIFIDSDDGSMTIHTDLPILQERCEGGHSYWIVEVPKSFQITLDLSNITDALYVYELVLSHKDTRVIQQD